MEIPPAHQHRHIFIWEVEAGDSRTSGVTDSPYPRAEQEMLRALDSSPYGRGRVQHAWVSTVGGDYEYGPTVVTACRSPQVSYVIHGDAWDGVTAYDLPGLARQHGEGAAAPDGTSQPEARGHGQADTKSSACPRLLPVRAGRS
ncbi:hypothetical protein [Spongiactinospora rosea]|uniref:hypothetical protein n=1 Tax=Spongiactinospora rosea TaxID=2248750 RepID=UPI0011C03B72|nr:hypothetical protein [Spongiactinospora rosea]